MQMMEMKQNKSFSPICNTKTYMHNNKEDKYYSPLSNENMHIYSNTSPPFCQSSTKGSK